VTRPRLLDLFCGAGGAAVGYHRAGFDVVGVDIEPQPHYPFEFWQMDALEFCEDTGEWDFDAIHASPPCQRWSTATPSPHIHPDLIAPIRELLVATGLPYVIENVPGSPLRKDLVLCGSMFGLKVRRHRIFESNIPLMALSCDHAGQGQPWGVYGDGGGTSIPRTTGGSRGRKAKQSEWAHLMGMEWADPQEIKEAIPPAYTEYIGCRLMEYLEHEQNVPSEELQEQALRQGAMPKALPGVEVVRETSSSGGAQ
jgi:DNA (cytosine-5)-methyltransferase 1